MCVYYNSRNNMFSVMSNTGFGPVTVIKQNGLTIQLPECALTKHGRIKKDCLHKINSDMTIEKATQLEEHGYKLFVGKVG